MGMTREGRASSTSSNSSSSMLAALRENTQKLAPPVTSVAPIGKLPPVVGAGSCFSLWNAISCTSAAGVALGQSPARQHGHHELGTSYGILKPLVVVEWRCRNPRLCGSSSARDAQAVKLVFDFLKCVLL